MKHLGQRYVLYVNRTYQRSSTLWEGRFRSCLLGEEDYFLGCQRYIELNPVRASMAKQAWDYRWSSVHAHLSGIDPDGIVRPEKLLSLTGDWKAYLKAAQAYQDEEFERHERTGRPLGEERFVESAERLLMRELEKKKPGPKVKAANGN
jgi:putative transposase